MGALKNQSQRVMHRSSRPIQSLDNTIHLCQKGAVSVGDKRRVDKRRRFRKQNSEPAVTKTTANCVCKHTGKKDDEDFEWYDLDSIREDVIHQHSNGIMIIGHHKTAGLIFTTGDQFFHRKANMNNSGNNAPLFDDSFSINQYRSSLRSMQIPSFRRYVDSSKHIPDLSPIDENSLDNISESDDSDDDDDEYNDDNDVNSDENGRSNNKKIDDLFSWLGVAEKKNDEVEEKETPSEKEERLFHERIKELEREVFQ